MKMSGAPPTVVFGIELYHSFGPGPTSYAMAPSTRESPRLFSFGFHAVQTDDGTSIDKFGGPIDRVRRDRERRDHNENHVQQHVLVPREVQRLGLEMMGAVVTDHVLCPVHNRLLRRHRPILETVSGYLGVYRITATNKIEHVVIDQLSYIRGGDG